MTVTSTTLPPIAPPRTRGFTLIELMVVVSILGILAAVGIPAFSTAYMTNRLASYSNNFVASVQFARSEAIKRNVQVTLCASSNGTSCNSSATSWQPGWIVKCATDSTGANCVSGGSNTLVLQKQDALNSSYSFTTTSPTSSGYSITFPTGGVGVSVGTDSSATLRLCRATPVGEQERVIQVTASGRTQVRTTTDHTCT